jgi:hypothetical protein
MRARTDRARRGRARGHDARAASDDPPRESLARAEALRPSAVTGPRRSPGRADSCVVGSIEPCNDRCYRTPFLERRAGISAGCYQKTVSGVFVTGSASYTAVITDTPFRRPSSRAASGSHNQKSVGPRSRLPTSTPVDSRIAGAKDSRSGLARSSALCITVASTGRVLAFRVARASSMPRPSAVDTKRISAQSGNTQCDCSAGARRADAGSAQRDAAGIDHN